jgi:hypothetical protein
MRGGPFVGQPEKPVNPNRQVNPINQIQKNKLIITLEDEEIPFGENSISRQIYN